jgi:hypothetical protein
MGCQSKKKSVFRKVNRYLDDLVHLKSTKILKKMFGSFYLTNYSKTVEIHGLVLNILKEMLEITL